MTPTYPADVPYPAFMLRVAEKFSIPLAALDEWPLDAILDEADVLGYLHDLDNPPPRQVARNPLL